MSVVAATRRGFVPFLGTLTSQGPTPAASEATIGAGASLLGGSGINSGTAYSSIPLGAPGTNFPIPCGGSTLIVVSQGGNSDSWTCPLNSVTGGQLVGSFVSGGSGALTGPVTSVPVTSHAPTHSYTAGVATVSLMPSEFGPLNGTCTRYKVHCLGIPDVFVDIAVAMPASGPYKGVMCTYAAEVFPYGNFESYDFEGGASGIQPIAELVAAGFICVNILHPAGNAWNGNTGQPVGYGAGLVTLAARCATIVNWVAETYAVANSCPFSFYGGSGAAAIGAALGLFYNLADLIAPPGSSLIGTLGLDAMGAGCYTDLMMSGLPGDILFAPGSIDECILADMVAGFDAGNYLPESNVPPFEPLSGQVGVGPAWLNTQAAIYGSMGGGTPSIGSVSRTVSTGNTSSNSLTMSSGVSLGSASGDWPVNQGRDFAGSFTVNLSGSLYKGTYWGYSGTGNVTLLGVTWKSGTPTGVNLAGATISINTTNNVGYLYAASYQRDCNNGPFAKPPWTLHQGRLHMVYGGNDVSGLPGLWLRYLVAGGIDRTKFKLIQVPNAPHDVASTTLGAQAIMASKLGAPTATQGAHTYGATLNGTGGGTGGQPPNLPGFTANCGWFNGSSSAGTYTLPWKCNPGDILVVALWSTSSLPVPPVTTNSPASGINSWKQAPVTVGGSTAQWALPLHSGSDGICSVWVKVATGNESIGDFAFTSSGTLYAQSVTAYAIGLDNAQLNSAVSAYYQGSSHTYTGGVYSVDTTSAATGTNTSSLAVTKNGPTGSSYEISIAIALYSNAASVPSNPISNGYNVIDTVPTGTVAPFPDGAHQGSMVIAVKQMTASPVTSSDPSFTASTNGTNCDIAAGLLILQGELIV